MKSNVFKIFLLTLVLFLVGGIVMTNTQDKPPLLNNSQDNPQQKPPLLSTPQNSVYGQVASPPPSGQVLPPPPPGQPVPPPPPPPEQATLQPQASRLLNGVQLKNASLAVATAKKAKPFLVAGRIWTMTGPRGEVEVKAAILYDGIAVAILHFNPADGSILPLGVHPVVIKTTAQLVNIKDNLPAIIRAIEVLDGAEYREPENAWVVPLAYRNMIVGHLKVYVDGIHIVPDYPANQEMQLYGK